MKISRRVCFPLWIFLLLASWHASAALPTPSREEIAATARWFDALEWPELRGKPYVEIVGEDSRRLTPAEDERRSRGWLIAEDERRFTVFVVRLGAGHHFGADNLPFSLQCLEKREPSVPTWKLSYRPADLDAAARRVLASLQVPKVESEEAQWEVRARVPDLCTVFVFARSCVRAGRADLAEQSEAAMSQLPPDRFAGTRTFQEVVRQEVASTLLWKAMLDVDDLRWTRADLLPRFEKIARAFPENTRAANLAEQLRRLIAEDQTHARAVRPLESMTVDEQAREWIFRLRDQHGCQMGQPAPYDVFGHGRATVFDSPADQLLQMGRAAVPALLEALSDRRPTRCVAYGRDFFFSHLVLTVGDCAQAILNEMSGHFFGGNRGDAQAEGDTKATRVAAEEWWRAVQSGGEKAMLIKAVSGGDLDGYRQIRRLRALDPAATVEALAAGLEHAPSHGLRSMLMRELGEIRGEGATAALRGEMQGCPSFHGRVIAAAELLRRGEVETIPAMIDEWRRWSPPPRRAYEEPETPEPLIDFLASCGDRPALLALSERFATLSIDLRLHVLEAALGRRSENAGSIGEELAIHALDDRAVRYGQAGSRGQVSFADPRVCDLAACLLAERWPERYQFDWPATRFQRDEEIVRIANAWRAERGLAPQPLPVRPVLRGGPATVESVRWSQGAPPANFPSMLGKLLTVEAVIEMVTRLHRDLPPGQAGFTFYAERLGDGRGFTVELKWNPGPRPTSSLMWADDVNITLGRASIEHSSGGGSLEERQTAASFEIERLALAQALAGAQPVTISFHGLLNGN